MAILFVFQVSQVFSAPVKTCPINRTHTHCARPAVDAEVAAFEHLPMLRHRIGRAHWTRNHLQVSSMTTGAEQGLRVDSAAGIDNRSPFGKVNQGASE